MKYEIAGRAIVGSKEPQQDAWRVVNARGKTLAGEAAKATVIARDRTLIVVADGIGGYAGGEIASNTACDTFVENFLSARGSVKDRFGRALKAANAAIADEKAGDAELADMGCTLIAVFLERNQMTFISVGDSLLLRSRDGEIHRVNIDHSYAEFLDRQILGTDDPKRWSAAIGEPRRRASLTLALTGGPLVATEYGHTPQVAERPLLPGDVLIIASDGIETLDLVQVQNFVRQLLPAGLRAVADGLIRAVSGIGMNRAYQDNTTIISVLVPGDASSTRVGDTKIVRIARDIWRAPLTASVCVLAGALAILGLVVVGYAKNVIRLTVHNVVAQDARQGTSAEPLQQGGNQAAAPPPSAPSRTDDVDLNPPAPVPSQYPSAPPSSPDGGVIPRASLPDQPSQAAPPERAGSPSGVQSRNAPKPPAQPAIQRHENIAYSTGYPISRVNSVDDCESICQNVPSCVAYTFHRGVCEHFGARLNSVPEDGAISGSKPEPPKRRLSNPKQFRQ